MSLIWKKLQRSSKRAFKFKFGAKFQEVVIQCSHEWQPTNITVAWVHRRRRYTTTAQKWEPTLMDSYRGVVVWPGAAPEYIEIQTTLYKDLRSGICDYKEWIFIVEEVSAGGRRKQLASIGLNLELFTRDVPGTLTEIRLKLKPLSRHVESCILQIVLDCSMLKEGDANDADVQSISSLMSRLQIAEDDAKFDESDSDNVLNSQLDWKTSPFSNEMVSVAREINGLGLSHLPSDKNSPLVELTAFITDGSDNFSPASALDQIAPTASNISVGSLPTSTILKAAATNHGMDDQSAIAQQSSALSKVGCLTSSDLLAWCQQVTHDYSNVNVTNFGSCWRSGLAFCAIIHYHRPDLIEFDSLNAQSIFENCSKAFNIAASLGVPKLIKPDDMLIMAIPDKVSVMTYLYQLRSCLTGQKVLTGNAGWLVREIRNIEHYPVSALSTSKENEHVSNGQNPRWSVSDFDAKIAEEFEKFRTLQERNGVLVVEERITDDVCISDRIRQSESAKTDFRHTDTMADYQNSMQQNAPLRPGFGFVSDLLDGLDVADGNADQPVFESEKFARSKPLDHFEIHDNVDLPTTSSQQEVLGRKGNRTTSKSRFNSQLNAVRSPIAVRYPNPPCESSNQVAAGESVIGIHAQSDVASEIERSVQGYNGSSESCAVVAESVADCASSASSPSTSREASPSQANVTVVKDRKEDLKLRAKALLKQFQQEHAEHINGRAICLSETLAYRSDTGTRDSPTKSRSAPLARLQEIENGLNYGSDSTNGNSMHQSLSKPYLPEMYTFKRFGSMRASDLKEMTTRLSKCLRQSPVPDHALISVVHSSCQSESVQTSPAKCYDPDIRRVSPGCKPAEFGLNKGAVEIEQELQILSMKQTKLDERGVGVEKQLRNAIEKGDTVEFKHSQQMLMNQFLEVLNERNVLTRREHQLHILHKMKQHEEAFHAVQLELTNLLQIDDMEKTEATKVQIDGLMDKLILLVNKRDELAQQLISSEQGTEEEEAASQDVLLSLGISKMSAEDKNCAIQ